MPRELLTFFYIEGRFGSFFLSFFFFLSLSLCLSLSLFLLGKPCIETEGERRGDVRGF